MSYAIDKEHIPIQTFVKTPLRRSGRQLCGPCPLCNDGHDRFYIDVQKNRWGCRICHPGYHDIIEFIMLRDGRGFLEACHTLKIKPERNWPHQAGPVAKIDIAKLPEYYPSQCPVYQGQAMDFIRACHARLTSTKDGMQYFDYLVNRGVDVDAINACQIGFNDITRGFRWGDTEVWAHRGIVIPWITEGVVWRVRFRTGRGDYKQAAGAANGLFIPKAVEPSSVVILVESEFDAISVNAWCNTEVFKTGNRGLSVVRGVATGGTTNARALRWFGVLGSARKVLVAFDRDDNGAGDKAAAYWIERLPNAVRLVPTRHDVNDMVMAGDDLAAWMRAGWTGKASA